MAWEDAAAQLGTGALVAGLKALKSTMKKGEFKRLVATTAAQVLAVHPDLKPKKARRWARRAPRLAERLLGADHSERRDRPAARVGLYSDDRVTGDGSRDFG